ncbi:MAG TPA: enoyl-CoA hydratase/isomerase family protein [Dongiaceae bacterium]|nr:enoyl-CoA hydratase/isomerase family protein [Dongiaceae bacterium]
MEFQTIQVLERADGIGIITLNRPEKRNALSIRMRREISACLTVWCDCGHVAAVVITGTGPVFSAGFDLDEFRQTERHEELFDSSSRYHRDLWHFPKPVVVAINGPAIGGGFDLTTLCDIRFCSETASFGHPEIKFGAPPLFTPLRWIIGDGLARDLCLTGRRIDAGEAQRIGLVSRITAADDLLESAVQTARSICEAPAATLRFAKEFFTGNAGRGFEESFEIEHDEAFRRIIFKTMSNAT